MLRQLLAPTAMALTLYLAAAPAEAGPPAVCHPITPRTDIAMPWGTAWFGQHSFRAIDRCITIDEALTKALEALHKTDDTLDHMEIVRRAVVYVWEAEDNRSEQKKYAASLIELLSQDYEKTLRASKQNPKLVQLAALRRFDLGYAGAGLHQIGVRIMPDYNEHLEKATEIRKNDFAMHLGAALGQWIGADQRMIFDHLAAALEGADDDELLAKNLISTAGPFLEAKTLESFRRAVHRKLGTF